jgi:hypothetical protein
MEKKRLHQKTGPIPMTIRQHKRAAFFGAGVLAILVALSVAQPACSAQVRAGLSSQETYVGLPVMLQIQISDAEDYQPPVVPQVDGLKVQSAGTPSRHSQVTIMNGRRSASTTTTFAFQITPQRAGNFTIPPIALTVDGRHHQTGPQRLVARVSETNDLLFVEIEGAKDEIYVGEALNLTLKIWLRPFQDQRQRITLSERDMWRTISSQSSWGPFAEQIQELADANRRPAGVEVVREDSEGDTHSYFLYEIQTTFYPQRSGSVDGRNVRIVVQYPTALGKSRDPFSSFFDDARLPFRMPRSMFDDDAFSPFGSRLSVKSVRPIVAEAEMYSIDVNPIPKVGRPADYRGAVGQYQIVTEADPLEVSAGDPITLHIGLFGDGPMDVVPAPPLAELDQLTADFKVPDEPLAGFVDDQRKIFSTTIRPRNENTTQIPAIPFSFFDPSLDQFVTVHSDPIPIRVSPAESLSLDAIVGHGGTNRPVAKSSSTEVDGLAAMSNVDNDTLLISESQMAMPRGLLLGILAVPPLIVMVIQMTRLGRSAQAFFHRFRSPPDQCRRSIHDTDQPGEIARLLQRLISWQFGLRGEVDSQAAVGALRRAGYRDLAIRFERLLASCESGGNHLLAEEGSVSRLQTDALELVDELQQRRRQTDRARIAGGAKFARSISTRSGIGLIVLATWQHGAGATETPSLRLSTAQQKQLLQEAHQLYEQGILAVETDSATAKQAFADAAEKYQMIVDSGVHNSQLVVNLANSNLLAGRVGKATADYRRALRLDPTSRRAQAGLQHALQAGNVNASPTHPKGLWQAAGVANGWINRIIHPHAVLATMVIAWLVLWLVVGLRLSGKRFPWKSVAFVALVVVSVTAASYSQTCRQLTTHDAVVTKPGITLRQGDGEQFPAATQTELSEGEVFEMLGERGDWIQVQTPTGQRGWLPRRAVELIE